MTTFKFSYLLVVLTLFALTGCSELNEMDSTKYPDTVYEYKRIAKEELEDWDDGLYRDDMYLVAAYREADNSTCYYISDKSNNGLYILFNDNGKIIEISNQDYCANITYAQDGYLVSWLDSKGEFNGHYIKNDSTSLLSKSSTRSSRASSSELLDPNNLKEIANKLEIIKNIETLGSDLFNADTYKFLIDLKDVGVDYLIGLLPTPLSIPIATLKSIIDGMNDSLYMRQRNALYGDCDIKIEEISNDGEGNINVYITIENANTIPTHLYHLYYDEPEDVTQNIIYWGIVGKEGAMPYLNFHTKPYQYEELLDYSTSSTQYKMLTFKMPNDGETYIFRAYLKSLRLKDKNDKVNENHIKYSDKYVYSALDAYITDFEQISHSYHNGVLTFKCSAKGYIHSLKDVIEWGIYYLNDDMQKEYFPSDYVVGATPPEGISSPNEDNIEISISLKEEQFVDNYKDIKLGIYTKGGYYLGYNAWSEPQLYSLYYENKEKQKLIDLYRQTNGDTWTNNTNWCSNKPLNEWYGIQIDELGYVTSIDLSNNNLTGYARLNLEDFSYLGSININNNKMEELSIRGNNSIKEIILNNCATKYISFENFDNVEISCEALNSLSGYCEILKVSNCDFGDNHTPFSGIEAKEATIYNCKMHSCGLSSEILTFESSSTYDTWYCQTSKRLNIVNSYCSTICGGDFNDNTVIHLSNATLWRSNWDEESRVTLSCTTTGAGWHRLFD